MSRPPYHEEAEVAVLGGAMISPEAAFKAVELVPPDAFYDARHRCVMIAIAAVVDTGAECDPVTVMSELERRGWSNQVGGVQFIAELMDAVPTAANLEYHARYVVEAWKLRSLATACRETVEEIEGGSEDTAEELIGRAESRISQALLADRSSAARAPEVLHDVFVDLERRVDAGGGLIGVTTGFPALDDITGGWQAGDLVLVAARPSMGKTAFATQTVLAAALHHTTDVYSLEMSKEALAYRLLAQEGIVDLMRLLRGELNDDEYARIAQAAGVIRSADLWIEDRGGLTLRQLRARVMRRKIEKPSLRVVMLDYLQLMNGGGEENRQQEISTISRGLKALAKEAGITLIALSQLSRAATTRSGHRPQLSDLRESGSLEQDADIVLFLHRPEYYMTQRDAEAEGMVGKAELIIGKQRNGALADIEMHFRKECCRFESPSPKPGAWARSA